MQYNWGDPKKNSLLTSRMMAKEELTRKKRLTSVKSTLSNQLHPAIENKLRKKKRAPDSTRHLSCDDDSNSETDSCTLDTIRHDVFPVSSLSSYPNNMPMFDEFSLNAAADGLFHPASAIEAFTEHDAKYRQESQETTQKPRSGRQRVRSRSEYPPSRENHRLPSIATGRTKTRPESTLPSAGTAPASMTTTSSLSTLPVANESERSLSAAQSDSTLYAPRRLHVVPSSADHNDLAFLEYELDLDNNSLHKSPTRELPVDNNEVPEHGLSVVPPLDFSLSLSEKFEELKQLMKSNREKRENSARQPDHQNQAASTLTAARGKKSAIRAAASGFSATKTASSKEKVTLKKRSTPAARATVTMSSGSSSSKRTGGNQVSDAASRKKSSAGVIVRASSTWLKKETKIHSGVSLSDLKAEHREALQMLKELGGPIDPDYQLPVAGIDASVPSKSYRVGRSGIKMAGSSLLPAGDILKQPSEMQTPTTTPPTTASSSVSMVTKLRESISSGRLSSRETSPRSSSCTEIVSSPAESSVNGATPNPQEKLDTALELSNQTNNVPAALDTSQTADPRTTRASLSPPPLSPNAHTADPWKQYENDEMDDEDDEDNNPETLPTARYSDEDFES